MTDPMHEQLLDYLLNALDEPEHSAIEARLKTDPSLCVQLEQIRHQLAPLERLRKAPIPAEGLADRTCRFVFSQRTLPSRNITLQNQQMGNAGPSGLPNRFKWFDLAIAVGVFFAAALVTIPAIEHSRFYARRAACENKLRQLGVAQTDFSEHHHGFFPIIPTKGNLAAAGIYAPILKDEGYLAEASSVICPDSEMAENDTYEVPSLTAVRTANGEELENLQARMGGSYGYNLGHLENGQYLGTKNERRPQFALMSDSPSNLPNHQTHNHGRHGQNVLFEDGHVQFLHSPQKDNLPDDFFRNDIGQVAAGLHQGDSVIGASNSPPIVYVGR